jgi:hypothetical protein
MSSAPERGPDVQRYSGGRTCPICNGSEDDRRGEGKRCYGFISGDGEWAHCTRDDGGRTAKYHPGSGTYSHSRNGECKCGKVHGTPKVSPQRKAKGSPKGDRVGRLEFVYLDEDGRPLFREVREEYLDTATGKRSKKPWVEAWNGSAFRGLAGCMKGVRLVPFGLPGLRALQPGDTVFVVEGPKKVEKLQALRLNATCNPYGAGKWRSEFSEFLRDFNVVVLPDENKVGRDHAEAVAQSVNPVAMSVRVVPLPGLTEKEDIVDWLEKGGTAEELRSIVAKAPTWVGASAIRIANVAGADSLSEIIVDVDQSRVIDEAEASLGDDSHLFARGNTIVRVLPSTGGRRKWHPDRPAGTPQISPVELATLSEVMSRRAVYRKWTTTKRGEQVLKAVIPPLWAVAGLAARGIWPKLRHLEGITETPMIREDGSLLDVPGWDEDTGLLYIPNGAFDPIPERPTIDDARTAASLLFDLVTDFPLKDENHKAAWLAALLTVVGRFAIDGPVPMFLFDANNRGSGKSLLCDLISLIAFNRNMARKAYPEDDAEMRKVLTSIAMVGDRTTLFDNIATGSMIGCGPLDMALTSMVYKDRPLATNKMPELPWSTVLFATGNNIGTRADTARRTVQCRLETDQVRPEEREDFKVEGSLLAHARKHRAALIGAALTILRAHAVAGRPMPGGLVKMDYPEWCGTIRAAVSWSTGLDPCATRIEARESDEDAMTLEALTAGWKRLCESEGKASLTVAQAVEVLDRAADGEHSNLRELFAGWSRDGKTPNVRSIGNRLVKYKRRPSLNGSLDFAMTSGRREWFVQSIKVIGFSASSASSASCSIAPTRDPLFSHQPSREGDFRRKDREQEALEAPEAPNPPAGIREVGEL